jgi:N-acetylglutamate synthase-like GNAT family acetyltransferase
MERTAVHPAYWRRGHGSTLAKYGLNLANIDQVNQAVLATSMGADLFKYMGFKLINESQINGGKEDPTGYTIAVLKYFPTNGE